MITVTVKQAARANGCKNPYQLSLKLALSSKSGNGDRARFERMAERLWDGRHLPTLTTLDLVCDALDCELSDLIVRNGRKRKK